MQYISINNIEIPLKEIRFQAVKSSGPGGQHVNKTASCVCLIFNVFASNTLTEEQKQIIVRKLKNRIGQDGCLRIFRQGTRSQWRNKTLALKQFTCLLDEAFALKKKRIPTRAGRAVNERRLQNKRLQSLRKQNRKKVSL